jgi:hypothetical protein
MCKQCEASITVSATVPRVAIQCADGRTGKVGTFAFNRKVATNSGDRFYSFTPVFSDIAELCRYLRKNGITVDSASCNLSDVKYRGEV